MIPSDSKIFVDPQFLGASDLLNEALETGLELVTIRQLPGIQLPLVKIDPKRYADFNTEYNRIDWAKKLPRPDIQVICEAASIRANRIVTSRPLLLRNLANFESLGVGIMNAAALKLSMENFRALDASL